jgi:hypothetical protein
LGTLSVVTALVVFVGLSESEAKRFCWQTATTRGRPSVIRFAEWGELDDWITDKSRTAKEIRKLKSFGLDPHIAGGRTQG